MKDLIEAINTIGDRVPTLYALQIRSIEVAWVQILSIFHTHISEP